MRRALWALLASAVLATATGCALVTGPGTCGALIAACVQPPPSDPWPAGATFTTLSYVDNETTKTFLTGTELVMRIGEPYALDLQAGCNTLSVTAHDQGEAAWLVVDSVTTTDMACGDALMDQDQWLADFFSGDVHWTFWDGVLTFTAGTDSLNLTESP